MKKLNLAIIGQGRSGRDIHGKFLKSEDNTLYNVVAIVEADAQRRQRALEEYPGCKVYSDYTELFDVEGIDLVTNATYSEMHYPITKDLLEHGFNVLTEKPFARNYYEACDLIKTAEEKGVLLQAFQQTFAAPFHDFNKEVIKSGKLGEIKQVSVFYNGFARRWDWQTLQCRMAGNVYNTGPHPIGLALDFLDFSDDTRVAFSKLDRAMNSGDAEDYAKIILTAPGKPVVDLEINNTDAFCDFNVKIQGSRGTYKATPTKYQMKYFVDAENEPRPVQKDFLKDANGYPIYCSEKLVTHEEEGTFNGTAFDVGTRRIYEMIYNKLVKGEEMAVTAEMAAKITNVIETVHAQNPMPIKF
ncbi:MAG: Gfo/Idh/MocA family oxidoreductase [Clostridia bacterium]|nr:Gfo/Idh/MocA family oxidoreductase [Clostridia bacterium]